MRNIWRRLVDIWYSPECLEGLNIAYRRIMRKDREIDEHHKSLDEYETNLERQLMNALARIETLENRLDHLDHIIPADIEGRLIDIAGAGDALETRVYQLEVK